MLNGRIKNLHNQNNRLFATIEYDNGNKLIFYDAMPNNHVEGEFAVGEEVYFEEKITDFGVEAKNLYKMTDRI